MALSAMLVLGLLIVFLTTNPGPKALRPLCPADANRRLGRRAVDPQSRAPRLDGHPLLRVSVLAAGWFVTGQRFAGALIVLSLLALSIVLG